MEPADSLALVLSAFALVFSTVGTGVAIWGHVSRNELQKAQLDLQEKQAALAGRIGELTTRKLEREEQAAKDAERSRLAVRWKLVSRGDATLEVRNGHHCALTEVRCYLSNATDTANLTGVRRLPDVIAEVDPGQVKSFDIGEVGLLPAEFQIRFQWTAGGKSCSARGRFGGTEADWREMIDESA